MPSIHQEDWYNTPLYYDIVFDEDTNAEAAFLEQVWAAFGGYKKESLEILEPACGSGRLVEAMSDRGHWVAGFDLNERMLAFAEERGTGASLFSGRMESFDLPKGVGEKGFDLAHCFVSTFKYMLTEAHAVAHLQLMAEHIRSSGIYVIGLHLTDYQRTTYQHERWSGERDGVEVVCNTRTWPPDQKTRLEDLRNRLRVTQGGQTKIQETNWQFRTYDARQVRALLRKIPAFEIVGCYDFWVNIDDPRGLDDSQEDLIVVLRRS